MKKLPERYIKIWQYMTDSNQPINESRIAGMLEEIFIARISETKDMLKSNIKTMKVKGAFDLRNDGWMQALVQKWEHTFMPDLHDAVKEIKAIPDIKDRAPRMRSFISELSTGTSPMNVLSIMEDDYRNDRESLHEPLEEVPEESETEPGYIRRVGRYAGSTLKVGAAGLGYAMMRERGIIGGIARGAAAVYGLHRTAKAFASRSTSAKTTQTRRSGALSNVFGRTKSTVAPKTTDFTPREEQLEGGGVTDILKRIEENTAELLKKFGGTPKGQGNEGGGILGLLKGVVGGIGSFVTSLLTSPAMLTAMAALGAALAVAFGDKAIKMICDKFPSFCEAINIPGKVRTWVEAQTDVSSEAFRQRRNREAYGTELESVASKMDPNLLYKLGESPGYDPNATHAENIAKLQKYQEKYGRTGGEPGSETFGVYQIKDHKDPSKSTLKHFLSTRPKDSVFAGLDYNLARTNPEEFRKRWYEIETNPATSEKSGREQLGFIQKEKRDPVAAFLIEKGFDVKGNEDKLNALAMDLGGHLGVGGARKLLRSVDIAGKPYEEQVRLIYYAAAKNEPKLKNRWTKSAELLTSGDYLDRTEGTPSILMKKPAQEPSVLDTMGITSSSPYTPSVMPSLPSFVTPKAAAPRATTIVPKTVEGQGQSAPTQINVLPNAQPTQGANTSGARPGHYNKDDSIAKIVIDRQSLSFS